MLEKMQFKVEPYKWQKDLLKMSYTARDLAILADMGTGKTSGVINVLRLKYMQYGKLVPTIIFSPLVTLFNWKEEFKKYSLIPENKVTVIHGSTKDKLKQFTQAIAHSEDQIIIVNYEALTSPLFFEQLNKWTAKIVVMDEAHYCKNHKAKRSKLLMAITKKASHRYIMTGTLMANKPTDIFMPFQLMDNGETFGTNYYVFERTYMIDANARWSHLQNHFPKWVINESKLPELHDKIYRKAIRVTKKECMDLPPLIEETYHIEMSPEQRKAYKSMQDDFLAYVEQGLKSGISVAQTALTKALRLQQIVSGFVKTDDNQIIEFKDNPRLDALEELITALHEEHKVIIWCSFKNNYKQIGKMLDSLKINHVYITGDESLTEKNEAMNSFNTDAACRVVVANRKAAGIGVNLVAADYSIVYSKNFSLTEELQSRDRNYRGGSQIHDRIVRINLCTKGTIDETTTAALADKQDVSHRIIDMVRESRI